jgi:phage tail-like protein
MSGPERNLTQAWLPEIYRETAIERVLAIIDETFRHIHGQIDELADTVVPQSKFFDQSGDAARAEQREYLEWFSGWVNLVLSEDWTHDQRRDILAKILPIYRKRGTREGLTEYLKIYAGDGIVIEDDEPPLQIGEAIGAQLGVDTIIGGFPPATAPMEVGEVSEVGANTVIEGFPPYYFVVRAAVSASGPKALTRKRKAIVSILEMEKPAHTWYRLFVTGPTFKIGDPSTATLGINTIL